MQADSKNMWSISRLAEQLRGGGLTCVELTQACLDCIDEREEQLNAWVVIDGHGALEQAKGLDEKLAAGQYLGPLHGIPIGVKDIIDVLGLPTAAGFEPWNDFVAEEEATLVTRLRDAGAVILGKTVTTQFACFDPPQTVNPFDPEVTPGGSSSGSAVATAVGMCVAAIGTQTGGSVIRPASYCGICGFKPTYATIPVDGIVQVSQTLDHPGPIARSIADLAMMFDVLAGRNSGTKRASKPPRIGCLGGMFHQRADADMLDVFGRSLKQLQESQVVIEQVELPDLFEQVLEHHRLIMLWEMLQLHDALFDQDDRTHYLPGVQGLIEEAEQISVRDYDQALRYRHDLTEAMGPVVAAYDALIMPATPTTPPDTLTTGSPAFNAPWSLLGFPEISMPMPGDVRGLPVALQLVSAPGSDGPLFGLAQWVETALQQAT